MIRLPRLLAAAFALTAAGLFLVTAQPAAAQRACAIRVYEHGGFGGDSFGTQRDIGWIGHEWNDRISSVVVEAGVWELYEHVDYGGRSLRLGPGEHSSLGPGWNDTVSSLRCIAGDRRAEPPERRSAGRSCAVTVFEHAEFDGESFEARRGVPWVGDDWNDRISSIVVEAGTWEFFEHADYGGRSFRMGPGERPFVGPSWNDRISSFRCIR